MHKIRALEKIAKEIDRCRQCKIGKIGKAVPGEGNPNAEIAFIGEAPGRQEAVTGRPFVGRSGKLLRALIHGIGLKEEDVYITSPVKYLPKRGTPTAADIKHGRVHLMKQLDIINPKFMVLLGSVACRGILEEKIPVLKKHGKVIENSGRSYFITLHPSAGLRFPPLKKLLTRDFHKLKSMLGK